MAVFVLKDASVTVNAVDLSDHVQQVELPAEVAAVEATVMGDDTEHTIPGLKGSTITVTFMQDFAAAKVDATIWPLYNAGTSHTLVIKPTSAAVGATNPSYTATVYVQSYNPISGRVGDAALAQVVFRITSGDLTRAVA